MDPIPLDPATYWRLRHLQSETELAQAKLAKARHLLDLASLTAGLAPTGEYRWDDATTSLIPVETAHE